MPGLRPTTQIIKSLLGLVLLVVFGGSAVSAATAPKPKMPSGYGLDAMWEVNAQNLNCDELNRLRYLQDPGVRNPSLAAVMADIKSDPRHSTDLASQLFSPVLRNYAQTANLATELMPRQTGRFAYNPDPPRPGELKMLGYLDKAARLRNCPGA